MKITRRRFIQASGLATAVGTVGVPYIAMGATKKVVVVGGGTGGATAAKYLRMMDSGIEVTLIEANKNYYTCYLSNEVLSGDRSMNSIKFGYAGLGKHGVKVVHDTVTGIDANAKKTPRQVVRALIMIAVSLRRVSTLNGIRLKVTMPALQRKLLMPGRPVAKQ